MKKFRLLIMIGAIPLVFVSVQADAGLGVYGTANYLGIDYNIIGEFPDTDGPGLMWLDYTKAPDTWENQVAWAEGLDLTVNMNPRYVLNPNDDWKTGWRLPSTVDGSYVYGFDGTTTAGYNITTSEMGHLYYVSLGNKGYFGTDGSYQSGWGLQETGPFNNLDPRLYWSGIEFSANPGDYAWAFWMTTGQQDFLNENGGSGTYGNPYAMAVHSAYFTYITPIPTSLSLFLSGFAAIFVLKRLRRLRE